MMRDLRDSLLGFWKEFRKFKYGMVGIGLFFLFVLVVIFEPLIIPFPEAGSRWRDISYWEDNPTNAVPIWTNWLTSHPKTTSTVLRNPEMKTEDVSGIKVIDGAFNYNYKFDIAPDDMVFQLQGMGNITVTLGLIRPDNQEINITTKNVVNSTMAPIKVSLAKDGAVSAMEFLRSVEKQENMLAISRDVVKPLEVFFSKAQEGIVGKPVPLQGEYKIKMSIVVMDGEVEKPELFVAGKAYGILGTDNSKRDLWSGVIAGTKWAMLIGLLTAAISVILGVIIGVTSAYFGGWIDSAIMRLYEVMSSIPFLPVLIVISAIFKPSIWTLIILMCVFGWVGPVRTVRSIGLQIKEETYIEAARALDASHGRIIFKHMIPQLVPYAFATMALSVPSSIVSEASLSLIGLGDSTVVTWGQILHDAMAGGAVLQGLWWWVVPPGILIAILGMTFAFIGYAMDTILNPRLRTR